MSRRTFHRVGEVERRRDLIAATLDVIAEQGLRAATVRQISARAGVTGGLIRHYFTTKDQMVQAAYRELMQGMLRTVDDAVQASSSGRDRMRAFIEANLHDTVTNARTITLWAAFIGNVKLDPDFAAIHREYYLAFLDQLERVLAQFLDEAGQRLDQPSLRQKTIAVNGMIDGLWLEQSVAGELFRETEAAEIAYRSVEKLLGLEEGVLA